MQIYASYNCDCVYFYFPYWRNPIIGVMFHRIVESAYYTNDEKDREFFIERFCYGPSDEMSRIKHYSQNPVEDENQLPFPMSYFYRNMIIGAFEATIDGI